MTPQELIAQYGPREAMEYDVVIVGAGPAGLSTAIRICFARSQVINTMLISIANTSLVLRLSKVTAS